MVQLGYLSANKEHLNALMRRLDLTKNGKVTIEELNMIIYFPHRNPPSCLFQKRRPISMEPMRAVNIYQQQNNNYRAPNQNNILNNESNTYYLITENNQQCNANPNSNTRQNYNSIQTESNSTQSRRLIIDTEEDIPTTYQYLNYNNRQMPINNPNLNRERPVTEMNELNRNCNHHYNNNYHPVRTEPNHDYNRDNRSRSYTNNNQLESRNNNNISMNQRRNIRISTDAYNEHPTLFDTNYIPTIPNSRADVPLNTINSAISVNERIANQQRQIERQQIHQRQHQHYNHNQSTSNIRYNNGQFNSNSIFPIRVSNTLRIRQSPERHNDDYITTREDREGNSQLVNQSQSQLQYEEDDEEQGILSEEDGLINILKQIIEIETVIENKKTMLSLQQDFNFEDAFRIFETKPKQSQLSLLDIKLGYASFNLFPSKNELQLLMHKYDLSQKGYLTYGEFFDILIPFKKSIRTEIEKRRPNRYQPSFNKTNVFNGITKELMKSLLSALINSESHLNNLRKAILTNRQNDTLLLENLFSKIDRESKGYLTPKDLKQFLKEKAISFTQNDIDLVYIRLDKDRDGQIQYSEFSDEFTSSID